MQNMDADEYESISDSYRRKLMLKFIDAIKEDAWVRCDGLWWYDSKLRKTLEENEDVRQIYQERFKYVFVDEYQDTNYMQYKMAKLFSDMYKNICVVGDADQSIYGWRGADIRNILNFEKDYKNVKTILLEQNYRSTKNILK